MLSLKKVIVQAPLFVQQTLYRLLLATVLVGSWQTAFAQCVTGVTATPTSASCNAINSAATGGNNGKITLTGFAAGTRYQYSTGATFAAGSAVPASITAIPAGGVIAAALPDPAVSQDYTVRVYDASNAACFTDLVVTLYHINCATICAGETYTLQAQTGLTNYLWYRDTGAGPVLIAGANTNTYIASTTGIYTYTGLNPVGCLVNLCQPVSLVPGCCTPLTVNITGNLAACNSGTTTITLTGASGAAIYLWSSGETTAAITKAAGTYTVTVTDGPCQTTRSAVITNTNITAAIAGNNFTCQGGTTTLTASGAATYAWSAGTAPSNTAIVTASAGTYTVTATAANGCNATASIVVTNTTITPAIAISGAANGCVAANTTITASGGTAYLWNTGAATAAIVVTPVASTTTYTVTVTGANGCSATTTASIRPIATPTAVSAAAGICVGEGTNLTASGAATYVWNTGATTAVINVTPVATTTYTVTATTAQGCTATATVTVNVYDVILNTSLASTDPTTCGGSNGTITVTATGTGATPLQYRINGGAWQASNVFNGLTAGSYIIETSYVGAYCTYAFAARVLSNPNPPVITFTGNNYTCNGGTSTLTANGAATYVWSNAATTAATTVTAGTYTVTATAANTCTATASFTVTNTTVTAAIAGNNFTCQGGTSALTASGTGAIAYAWSNGINTAANTVSAGTYTVTVTGANGCNSTASIVVTNTTITAAIAGNNFTCQGGTSLLTASGGTSYAWSNGVNTAANTVSAGTYTVTVTGANGCNSTASIVVTNTTITAAIAGSVFTCQGGTSALTASGGTAYAWSNGVNTAANTVSAGTYTVTVTGANGCNSTASIVVTNTTITAAIAGNNFTCQGGTSALTASGGTSYAWSNGVNTAANTVSAGTYTVTVTGGNGCNSTASIVVTNTTITPAIAISGAANGCVAANTTITASGGTSYSWNTGATTAAIVVTPVASTTIYTVIVTGANGCSATTTTSIRPIATPTAVSAAAGICVGEGTDLTASGAATYVWNTGATTAVINVTPVATTTYTVTATTVEGCTATATVTVNVFDVILNTSLASTDPTTCGGSNGTITVTATGTGATPLQYRINGGAWQASNVFNGLSAGSYVIETSYVGAFCTYAFAARVLSNPNPPVITFTGNNYTCQGGTSTLTANGAATYAWSAGASPLNTATVTVSAGTYTVTATAANTCTATASFTLTNTTIVAAIAGNNFTCQGGTSALTASGGTSYAWSNGINTAANTVSAGTYTVTVTGANGCNSTASIVVTNTTITPSITGANDVCVGSTASFTAAGGTSYAWSNGQNTATMTTTTAGTYTVTVTGANGCNATTTTTLVMTTAPTGITAAATVSTCWSGVANNDAKITLSGFTAGQRYQYSVGTTFNAGAAVPGAITAIPAGGIIAAALPNPVTASETYTIRLYSPSNADCFTDIQVVINRVDCACPTQNCGTILFFKN